MKIIRIEIKEPLITYPDVDSDFGTNLETGLNKDNIIQYLIDKYGSDYVSSVGNRLLYAGKSAIRDLGQVYEIPSAQTQAVTKAYNNKLDAEQNEAISSVVAAYFKQYPALKDKIDRLVGTVSGLGVHAGGVIISDAKRGYNLRRWCALQRPQEEKHIATLWTKKEIEQIGLIKYDILGLTSATQIHYAKKMAGLDPYEDCPEDIEVFKHIVLEEKHRNIFQFEGDLGRRAFADLKPMSIMEVANASGLIRLLGSESGRETYDTYKNNIKAIQRGNIDFWIDNIRNQIIEDHNFDVAVHVLAESYGVLIYQEQLAYLVVGFSNGEKNFVDGNNARKELDKLGNMGYIADFQGNENELRKWHTQFMAILNEYVLPYIGKDGWGNPDPMVRDFLNFNLREDGTLPVPTRGIIGWFISAAAYLFSKLHAVAYSINTYNMMYLKFYYPLEFWTASLISEQGDTEKISTYITAIQCEEPFIKIMPPDVNFSDSDFTMHKVNDEDKPDEIRFGLSGIMNVGKAAVEIIKERKKNGNYADIKDFIKRTEKFVNKRVIESLFFTGSFESLESIENVYRDLVAMNKLNLEADFKVEEEKLANKELSLLGVNIRFRHPILDSARHCIKITDLSDDGRSEKIGVKIVKVYNKMTKKNRPYKLLKCVCVNSQEQFNVFDWNNGKQNPLSEGEIAIVKIKRDGDFYQLMANMNSNSTQYRGRRK